MLLRRELAHLLVSDFKLCKDGCELVLTISVELECSAHDDEAFEVPLVENVSAVVADESILAQVHDVPRLVIGQPILFPIIDDLAGHANVLTGRCDVRPHLASVGSEHVEIS